MLRWLKILAGIGLAGGAGLAFLRTVWFHRDPRRTPDETENVLISPADGMVVYVKEFRDGVVVSEKLGEAIPIREILHTGHKQDSGVMLGIYLSPLDVHYNYAPSNGVIQSMNHFQPSVNLPMVDVWEYVKIVWLRRLVQLFGRRFHLENERMTIFMDCPGLSLALVLIADKFVSKIKPFVSPGQEVKMGQKLAFIGRGSQADVVLFGQNAEVIVRPGDRVFGGQSVLARLKVRE